MAIATTLMMGFLSKKTKQNQAITMTFASRYKMQNGNYDDHVDDFHTIEISIKSVKRAKMPIY